MNREDINKFWSEAYVNGMLPFEQREKFARLVAAAEREACAKVCHDYATRHGLKGDDNEKAQAWMMLQCAAAIRARGE